MIRFEININDVSVNYNDLFYKFCSNKLNDFKIRLSKNVNIQKFNLRYDYLIDNNILEFNGDIPNSTYIINTIIQSFRIYKSINATNNICISYNIPDNIYITNSNMEISYFVRFIEYGNEEMPPYKWISHTWKDLTTNIREDWESFKKLYKKLEDIKK